MDRSHLPAEAKALVDLQAGSSPCQLRSTRASVGASGGCPSGPSRSPPTEDPTVKIAKHRSMQQSRPCRLGRCADCGRVNRHLWCGGGGSRVARDRRVRGRAQHGCRPRERKPMPEDVADAVVIGAGPNGLVARQRAGRRRLGGAACSRRSDEVGGAVRTARGDRARLPNDLFSAFYPLAAASPVIRGLDLERSRAAPGSTRRTCSRTRWTTAARRCCRPRPGRTAASVDEFAPGDGDAWLEMCDALAADPRPAAGRAVHPVPAGPRRWSGCCAGWGSPARLDLARLAVLPVRRLAEEHFRGDGAALLLTGNAMHSDVPPDAAGSGVFGWLLAMLGQDVGFPVPRGRCRSSLAEALRSGSRPAAAESAHRARVDRHRGHRRPRHRRPAADGSRVRARRAVLADVAGAGALPRPGRAGAPARRGWAATSTGFSGTTPRQGQLGAGPAGAVARGGRARRRHRAPRRRTATDSSTSPPTCRPAGCRGSRSCCSGR